MATLNQNPLAEGISFADLRREGINLAEADRMITEAAERAQDVVDRIVNDSETIARAKASSADILENEDGSTVSSKSLWGEVMEVVGIVAEATAEHPRLAGLVFAEVMAPLFKGDNDSLNTARAYASTGKNVLTGLVIADKRNVADLSKLTYAEVRRELNPPADLVADKMLNGEGGILAKLRYVGKNGGKFYAKDRDAYHEKLQAVADAVAGLYNPIKAAKDANSRKAKAAREGADNRQQAPTESGTTETVKPTAGGRPVQPTDVVRH